MITWEFLVPAVSVATAIIGSIIAVRSAIKKERRVESARILDEARDEIELSKTKLEAKINAVDFKLKTLESSVHKDLQHIRETHVSELKTLSDKIENLREELRNQHSGIVSLLAKLIEKK
jgi:peptidoglycan hydrolase CwlO-like protein